MSFEKVAERKLREAIADGAFNVIADGRPLDQDAYFAVPAELRLAYSILRNAGCVPEEVEHMNEVARLRDAVSAARDEAERTRLGTELAAAQLRLDVALERARQQRK